MAGMDDLTARLDDFKGSGLIADYELMVADDAVRVRVVAPRGQDAGRVKTFLAETFAGILSETQISVEAPEG